MTQEVVSKETIYNGYRFRSRLEARWAVFFDKLKVPYQYEPDTFHCTDGSQYTPDFFLPKAYLRSNESKGLYLEVKHEGWNEGGYPGEHREYIGRISTALSSKNLVMFCGEPADAIRYQPTEGNEQLCPSWDNYMGLVYCEKCGALKAEFWESAYLHCPCCNGEANGSKAAGAAIAARQFRFQFHK